MTTIVQILAWLGLGLGAFQLLPIATAWLYGEPTLPFVASALLAAVPGAILIGTLPRNPQPFRPRDGFVVVVLAWVVASLLGAAPYVFSSTAGVVDALFESSAGFTTTGATVLSGLEQQPRSILLWRSLTQWLGGMGIIVFAVALLPLLGVGGMQLFRAESPSPVTEKIAPRMAETARRLWLIYLGVTGAEIVLLSLAGMSVFEAVCHSMTTAATGGFSTRDDSIRAFASPAIEWIVIVFMVIGGINYAVHFELLTGRFRQALRDRELHYFLFMVGFVSILMTILLGRAGAEEDGIRKAAFQVVALMTGTGYHSAVFDEWPMGPQMILLVLMLLGGMAGSTTGGVKGMRVLLSLRVLSDAIIQQLHPKAVQRVKHDDRPVTNAVLSGVWGFLFAYALLVAFTAFWVAASGYDLATAVSVGASAVGNVGPALGDAGPTEGYAGFPAHTKLMLSAVMIAGRLEILAVLVFFAALFRER